MDLSQFSLRQHDTFQQQFCPDRTGLHLRQSPNNDGSFDQSSLLHKVTLMIQSIIANRPDRITRVPAFHLPKTCGLAACARTPWPRRPQRRTPNNGNLSRQTPHSSSSRSLRTFSTGAKYGNANDTCIRSDRLLVDLSVARWRTGRRDFDFHPRENAWKVIAKARIVPQRWNRKRGAVL